MCRGQVYFSSKSVEKTRWLTDIKPASFELLIHNNVGKFEESLRGPINNKKLTMRSRVAEVKEWLNIDLEICNIMATRVKESSGEELDKLRLFIG
jgi:hypothetical protein